MVASARKYTGSFGNTSLPRIDLNRPLPIPGALVDFASDSMSLGSISSWVDLVNDFSWAATGGVSVVNDGGGPAVTTDGVDGILRAGLALNQPQTVICVGRLKEVPAASSDAAVMLNDLAGGRMNVGLGFAGLAWRSDAGTWGNAGGSAPLTDTNWHVFMASFNGADSAVRVDAFEQSGLNLGANTRTGIRAGYGAGYNKQAYKRVAILPFATTAAQRHSLYLQMKARYGL